jgi:Tol biopolymer transport system component
MGGGTGKLIFEYYKKGGYEKSFPEIKGELNIFTANWDGTDITPITNGLDGYNHFESVSPDGKKILVSSFPSLFLSYAGTGNLYIVSMDGSEEPQKVSGGIYKPIGQKIAAWLDSSRIVFISRSQKVGPGVFVVNSDGTDLHRISKTVSGAVPVALLPTTDSTRINWYGCNSEGGYTVCKGIWWSSIEKVEQSALFTYAVSDRVISPDGSMVVWNKPVHSGAECCAINASPINEIDTPHSLKVKNSDFETIWSPDGSKVLLFHPSEEWNGKLIPYSAYLLTIKDMTFSEIDLPFSKDVSEYINIREWSPDGRRIIFHNNDRKGTIRIKILDMETMTISEDFSSSITKDGSTEEKIWGVYWLPKAQ